MLVNVDDARNHLDCMQMDNMIADFLEELEETACLTSVGRKWIQNGGSYKDYFGIALTKRMPAPDYGAGEEIRT